MGSKEHEALVKARIEKFEALPEDVRVGLDADAQRFRNVFGENANWKVWGEPMLTWEELPEPNRQNWREVAFESMRAAGAAKGVS